MLSRLLFSSLIPILTAVFVITYQAVSLTASKSDMAWRSSGATHQELIENLYKNGIITDERIKAVMLQVDRADFTNEKTDAYKDRPQKSNANALLSSQRNDRVDVSRLVGYAVSKQLAGLAFL